VFRSPCRRGPATGIRATTNGFSAHLIGATERTVKNWFAGTNGPSGEHLVALIRHSDKTLETILDLAGRKQTIAANRLFRARKKLLEIVELIEFLSVE
jgi:hypothetical protein